MRARALAALAALAALGAAPSARAQEGELAAATALATAISERGALPSPVAVRVRASLPDGAPDPHGLVPRLLAPTLDALREGGAVAHLALFRGEGEEAAHTAARLGYRALVELEIDARGGDLVLVGRAWETRPAQDRGELALRATIDRGLRAFLGFPPLVTQETVRVRRGGLAGQGYLALAVADLDGDGRGELIAAREDAVRVFRIEPYDHPRFGPRVRARLAAATRWPDDLPLAASRRRRVVLTAAARGDTVWLRSSDHAVPVTLRWNGGALALEPAEGCEGFPVDAGCAALVDGRDFFDETIAATPTDAEPHVAAAHFYVHRAGRFVDREGAGARFEALVTPHGRMALRVQPDPSEADPSPRARTSGAVGYGIALAMTDLDLDGQPELLASHASPAGEADQLTLLRALPRGALRVVWRGEPTEGSIWAAAAGDVDGDGLPELLAVEAPADGATRRRSRLWMVR